MPSAPHWPSPRKAQLADGGGVSDETWPAMRKHYDDDQVGALVCLVAMINAQSNGRESRAAWAADHTSRVSRPRRKHVSRPDRGHRARSVLADRTDRARRVRAVQTPLRDVPR